MIEELMWGMRCVVGVTYFFLARLPIVYEMYAID